MSKPASKNGMRISVEQPNMRTRGGLKGAVPSTKSRLAGLRTLAELNGSAPENGRAQLLDALVESAARLGQYDRAMAIERLRAAEAIKPEEKKAIEKRLAEIIVSEKSRQARLALLTRIDRSNAISAVYAARVLGN